MRRPIAAILCTLASLWSVDVAQATASYRAELDAELALTGFFDAEGIPIARPPELVIEGEAALVDRFAASSGSAEAEAVDETAVLAADPLDLAAGEGVALSAVLSGSADAPAGGSEGLVASDGLIFFDNRSPTEIFRIGFELPYEWLLEASREAPDREEAGAELTLLLASLAEGTLFGLSEQAVADVPPVARADAGVFSGQIVLAPLAFEELVLIVDARGRSTVVPEPAGAALAGAAALAMVAVRVRRTGR